jgi:MarR family 2-MHQ and catechol resistance regulon transcriptional repressor
MLYTYDLLHQIMSRRLSEYGLSRSTFNILMLLKQGEPQGMLLSDLGELMLVSRANITGLIDHLEGRGYVRRVVDEKDRRARFAQLTEHGKRVVERYAPVHFRIITELLRDLSGEEKEALVALLHKTRESLRSHAAASTH